MLLRMRCISYGTLLILLAAPFLRGQTVCAAAGHAEATRAKAAQKQLLSVKLPEDSMGQEIAPALQSKIVDFKTALATFVDSVMQCQSADTDSKFLTQKLASLLDANHPELPPGTFIPAPPADTPAPQYIDQIYGADIQLTVEHPANLPKLLIVTLSFGIECGNDEILLAYESSGNGWRPALHWQSPPYKDAGGAFGDFFKYAVIPNANADKWDIVVAHGHPWCTSRWSGFTVDLLQPAESPQQPTVLWHKDDGYVRFEIDPKLKAIPQGFDLRLQGGTIEGDVMTRMTIYRYRWNGTTMQREQPVAMNGRDFVDEWIQAPWTDAATWTKQSRQLHELHEAYNTARNAPYDEKKSIIYGYGSVLACQDDKNHFQVEIDHSKPGGVDTDIPEYFQIEQGKNSFTLLDASSKPDPHCGGHDLMPPP